jgi:anti-sigma factor RsiW
MTCHDCRGLLTDYQHGELDAATDAALHDHLQTCPSCRAELDAESALTDTLRSAFAQQLELPTAVLARVRQAVRAERAPGFVESVRALLRPVVLAPAAAVIVLVVAAVSYLHPAPSGAPQQLSTAYFVQRHVAHTMDSQSGDPAWNAYLLTSNVGGADASAAQ